MRLVSRMPTTLRSHVLSVSGNFREESQILQVGRCVTK